MADLALELARLADEADLTTLPVPSLTRLSYALQSIEDPERASRAARAAWRRAPGDFWACWGPPSHNDYVQIGFRSTTNSEGAVSL